MKQSMLAVLRESVKRRQSVTLYMPCQTINLIATHLISTEVLAGTNSEFDRIQVHLDQVLAVAVRQSRNHRQ